MSPVEFPKIRVLLAGEGFPEPWREHVARTIGGDVFDVISLLGSADAGLIGFESDHSIRLRKAIADDEHLRLSLIHSDRVPGILHFDPCHRFLESSGAGELLITADRTIPLIRYNTMDVGGILSGNVVEGVQLNQSSRQSKNDLPLVYLFGRGAKSATIYGANIHAEWIQEFLVESSVQAHTSGRFQMETIWLPNCDQQLSVRLELVKDFRAIGDEAAKWAQSLAGLLRLRSTEYFRISEEYGARALPVVTLHDYGCAAYFPPTQKKCS